MKLRAGKLIAGAMGPALISAVLWSSIVSAQQSPALRETERQPGWDAATDWESGSLEVTGRGFAHDNGNSAQAESLALEAARTVAYAHLAQSLNSVRVTGKLSLAESGGAVQTRVEGVVRGAHVAKQQTSRQKDAVGHDLIAAEVTLRVCLTGASEACRNEPTLSAIVLEPAPSPAAPPAVSVPAVPPSAPVGPPAPAVPVPAPVPVPKPPVPVTPPAAVSADYSGVIIDVGQLPFLPVLLPEILSAEGKPVFSGASVKRSIAANKGAAQYAGSIADARKKPEAGPNPLIVHAVQLTPDNRIQLSESDAQAVLAADHGGGLFQAGHIVIVLQ